MSILIKHGGQTLSTRAGRAWHLGLMICLPHESRPRIGCPGKSACKAPGDWLRHFLSDYLCAAPGAGAIPGSEQAGRARPRSAPAARPGPAPGPAALCPPQGSARTPPAPPDGPRPAACGSRLAVSKRQRRQSSPRSPGLFFCLQGKGNSARWCCAGREGEAAGGGQNSPRVHEHRRG